MSLYKSSAVLDLQIHFVKYFFLQPFLPESNSGGASVCPGDSAGNGETISYCQLHCHRILLPTPCYCHIIAIIGTESTSDGFEAMPTMGGLPSIYWPFIAIGIWHFVTAAGGWEPNCHLRKHHHPFDTLPKQTQPSDTLPNHHHPSDTLPKLHQPEVESGKRLQKKSLRESS